MGVQKIPVEESEPRAEAEASVEESEPLVSPEPEAPQPKKRGRPRKDASIEISAPPKAPKAKAVPKATAPPKAPKAPPKAPRNINIPPREPFEALSSMSSVQLLSELVGRQRQSERERKQELHDSFVLKKNTLK